MSKVKTLIRPEAKHVRIVSLTIGDVYKRLVTTDRYGSACKTETVFGVVTDVMSDGKAGAVAAIEWARSYGSVEARFTTLVGDSDEAIFPAQPDEVGAYFTELAEVGVREVAKHAQALADAVRKLAQVQAVARMELTAPKTTPVVIAGEVEG